ncbi:MAG: RNA polymerase sigma factor [Azospirillaceae bacterium]|nr:RNA polymerase sigma factor [Azospirillaceae bacterium]
MTGKDLKGLFLDHRRELHSYINKRVRNADTAADLTQETFLRFAEQRQGRPDAAITHERSYLYRTAHNLAVDHIRQQQREQTAPVAEEDLAAIPDETPGQDRVSAGIHDLDRVRAALLDLPERTRQVFALTRIEGLTYREVAQRLEISDSSVQKHLARAIKQVMQRLRSD